MWGACEMPTCSSLSDNSDMLLQRTLKVDTTLHETAVGSYTSGTTGDLSVKPLLRNGQHKHTKKYRASEHCIKLG
jgi:hypothetical protein